jgi:hypothetical protein
MVCLVSHVKRENRAKVMVGASLHRQAWIPQAKTGITMKKLFVVTLAVLITIALAAPLGISGTVKTSAAIGNLRIAAFLVDRNGNPTRELTSVVPNNASFALVIPEAPPAANSLGILSSDALDWPGLLGDVKITGQARAVRAMLRGYNDTDKNGVFGAGDKLLETTLTRGRGNLIMIYAESRFRVQGDRGFDLTLEAGWNLVAIELGKVIETKRVDRIDNVQLEVFASQGY